MHTLRAVTIYARLLFPLLCTFNLESDSMGQFVTHNASGRSHAASDKIQRRPKMLWKETGQAVKCYL